MGQNYFYYQGNATVNIDYNITIEANTIEEAETKLRHREFANIEGETPSDILSFNSITLVGQHIA